MTALDSFPVSIQQPKCPKLDSTLKAQVPKACKDGDRLFCRLRTLVLDTVGPLTRVLELQQKGRLTSEAASQAWRFQARQAELSPQKNSAGSPTASTRLASIGGGTRQVLGRSSCSVWSKLCPVREGPC